MECCTCLKWAYKGNALRCLSVPSILWKPNLWTNWLCKLNLHVSSVSTFCLWSHLQENLRVLLLLHLPHKQCFACLPLDIVYPSSPPLPFPATLPSPSEQRRLHFPHWTLSLSACRRSWPHWYSGMCHYYSQQQPAKVGRPCIRRHTHHPHTHPEYHPHPLLVLLMCVYNCRW